MYKGTVLTEGQERQKKKLLDCWRKDKLEENRRMEGMNERKERNKEEDERGRTRK
jgi:hypothetical protein